MADTKVLLGQIQISTEFVVSLVLQLEGAASVEIGANVLGVGELLKDGC